MNYTHTHTHTHNMFEKDRRTFEYLVGLVSFERSDMLSIVFAGSSFAQFNSADSYTCTTNHFTNTHI